MTGSRRLIERLALPLAGLLVAAACGGAPTAGGPAQRTVKVAIIMPLTGPNAAIGLGLRNAARLALDQANATNAIPGVRIEILELDDESKPESGVAAATKAGSDPDVIGAIAQYNSPVMLASIPKYHEMGLLAINPGSVNFRITKSGFREILRLPATDIGQTDSAAEFATKILAKKAFSVIDDKTNYGQSLREQFVKGVEKRGGRILSSDGIAVGEKDFTALLTKLKGLAPEHVYFGGLSTEAGLIKSQMLKLGISATFQSGTGIWSDTFITVAGREAAEGSFCSANLLPLDSYPGGKKFLEDYQKAGFREPMEAYGPYGYAAGQLMVEALRRAGPGADRPKLVETARGIKGFDTLFGKVSIDDEGQLQPELNYIYWVKGGKWVPYDRQP